MKSCCICKMGDLVTQLREIVAIARNIRESIRFKAATQSITAFEGVIEEALQRLGQDSSLAATFYSPLFNSNQLQAWLRTKDIEARNADILVQNFLEAGVEIRNASLAFQGNEGAPVICFFFRASDYADPFLASLKKCLGFSQEAALSIPVPSVYGSPGQLQQLFEYQRLFLYYARARGNPAIQFVAAEGAEVEAWTIVLRESRGTTSQVFIPPGEPFDVRVQVSPDGTGIEVHWKWPFIGGNYLSGFLVWSKAESDPPESWKYILHPSSPSRFPLPVPGRRYLFKVSASSFLGIGPCSPVTSWDYLIPQMQQLSMYRSDFLPMSNYLQPSVLTGVISNGFLHQHAMSDHQDKGKVEAACISPPRAVKPAEYLKANGNLSRPGEPSLYQILALDVMRDPDSRTAKREIHFEITHEEREEKVIILLGATGAGKSTLVNALFNQFYGVQWEDPFRLELIPDTENEKPKAQSQTSWITAYTFPWQEGCEAPYNLTVVDTPGFCDTKGLMDDNSTMTQLHNLFAKKKAEGLSHINGIGFVLQSSNARLTPTDKYIFDSILSVFGSDVVNNIYLMITFADSKTPPVLQAVTEGKVPFVDYFCFNNSALFAPNEESKSRDNQFSSMFWKLGKKNFSDFFLKFQKSKPVSVQLSNQVLREGQALEATIQGIQTRIQDELNTLNAIRKETAMVEQRKAEVNANKNFIYDAQVTKQRRIKLMEGEYVTNCLNCNFTCHYPCVESKERKGDCDVVDPSTGDCTVCPFKCHWKKHVSSQYRYETYVSTEKKTLEDLKLAYGNGIHGKLTAEKLVEASKRKCAEVRSEVMDVLREAHQKLSILDEIALKESPMTITDYIDMLTASEKFQMKPGWEERIQILQEIRMDEGLERTREDGTRFQGEEKVANNLAIFSSFDEFQKAQHHHVTNDESTGNDPQERHVFYAQTIGERNPDAPPTRSISSPIEHPPVARPRKQVGTIKHGAQDRPSSSDNRLRTDEVNSEADDAPPIAFTAPLKSFTERGTNINPQDEADPGMVKPQNSPAIGGPSKQSNKKDSSITDYIKNWMGEQGITSKKGSQASGSHYEQL
ncbi:unnamed protein product [Darwinula stevensoni]|uniref:Fibronectin type-III domain-containing protein n=1 Tax=Darwinula stevensoni TaxID=69355 RepID=A0A7R9FQM6_9CRUS|nr:unnamed protein product [Darwinula stevensoni]CAG0899720.1 unnamed protein product [Darwinula stevensoni]